MERLDRLKDRQYEYTRLIERCETLEALAEKTTTTLSDMPKSPQMKKETDDTWALLIDTRIECERAIREYIRDCAELEKELLCIRSGRIRTAMKYKYIDGLSIEEIGKRMGFVPRTVYYMITKGRNIYYSNYGKGE